ncbi:hypothetical protein [Bradyrhizobium sp. RP6]|uniref:hypothetical protein n=1 Tax=Bradyrhizobium sp. RP6 TaxID=2489596 RepID=UPI000F532117|nr:hypothetical protein [Bradyrhizobium sp. RP6]RQH11710.1 hypothetical protein EHH60_18475 [Bradyrhizobium sp. RP6]
MRNGQEQTGSQTGSLVKTSRISWLADHILWPAIWLAAVALAALVHLAFFVAWPDNFIHEDSAAYLDETRAILTGHYVEDMNGRPYGLAFFFFMLSKLFAPDIRLFVAAQHVMSVVTGLLIAAIVRFAGAPRIFSLLAFLLATLYARTVHYDNTIGAETTSVFLMSLAAFMAAGIVFRNWSPFRAAAGIGLSIGAVMLCRSAAVGAGFAILLWLLLALDMRLVRRLAVLAVATGFGLAVYAIPIAINAIVEKRPATDVVSVMAFVIGYSGDFDHGVHLERKAQARQFVTAMRGADGPQGWADIEQYQWPLYAIERMRRPGDSKADFERIVRDIFVETVTTPSTLWRHVSQHFTREMFFLLFDGNYPASRASRPDDYEYFVKRDVFEIFHSPTGLKSGTLIRDHYDPPAVLSRLLPSADGLQAFLHKLFSLGYAPRYDRAPLCCGLSISSEYDFLPGPIRWLSAGTLLLAALLLACRIFDRPERNARLTRNLAAAGILMLMLAFINAAFPAFLVYGFNRYAYYVTPFMAGACGILGAVLVLLVRRHRHRAPMSRF